jgi:DNA polymerase III subunit delta'
VPFRDLAGHRRLASLLSRAIAHGTLPPSLIFAGLAGVGKFRTAVAVAQALNCTAPVEKPGSPPLAVVRDACGACAACRRIDRRVHPDVLVIEPGEQGSIRIDQVREAIDRAGYRPFEGRRRVVIVDEADALVEAAQHALLKTLEEPPAGSVFVLVTSMPDALLATVRSRCPRMRFGPLSAGEVAEALRRVHGYSDAEAMAAAGDAGGSVGRALAQRTLDHAGAREAARDWLLQAARGADPARRIEAARAFSARKLSPPEERERLSACLRALASLLRDVELLALRGPTDALANADLEADLSRVAGVFERDRACTAFMAVDRGLAAIERNASPKVVADWVVLQL